MTGLQLWDGVLGMSLTDMTTYGVLPVFNNMVDQGAIENPVFSFWYSRYIYLVVSIFHFMLCTLYFPHDCHGIKYKVWQILRHFSRQLI